jgi:DNA-directed RNA polymerase subunit H (RpoH/RPB5)
MRQTEDPLLNWLRKHPRPHKLRVACEDGVLREVELKGAQLPRIVQTVRALQPQTIEGLNPDGSTMKAIGIGDLGELDDAGDGERIPTPAPMFQRTPLPQITAADPETQRYLLTATLIANAYAHGYEVAFERLAEMVDGWQQRSSQLDLQREAFHRAQIKQLEQQLKNANIQPATEDGGLGAVMLQQFFSGQQTAAQQRAAPQAANGHDVGGDDDA